MGTFVCPFVHNFMLKRYLKKFRIKYGNKDKPGLIILLYSFASRTSCVAFPDKVIFCRCGNITLVIYAKHETSK